MAIIATDSSSVRGLAESPFQATVSCDVNRPARLTVTNTSSESYELRDIDSAGVNAVDGRPVLQPNASYTNDGIPNGTAILQAFEPNTNTPVGPRLTVDINCSVSVDQPLEITTSADDGGTVTISNVSERTVQLRDLDSRGGDLFAGRPLLSPGETLVLTDVANGTYYVQAWNPGTNKPLADPVLIVVDATDRAFFDVVSVGTGSSTTAGDEFDVSATITNTGDGPGTRTIELRFDDETVATKDVTIAADESTDITFVLPGEQTIEFEPNRTYTVTVDSGDDAESTEKYVLPP